MASLEMFKAGYFSSDQSNPFQADSAGLKRLSPSQLARGLQASDDNPLIGLEGRSGLMYRLGDALRNTSYFGRAGRPGHMLGMKEKSPLQRNTDIIKITFFRILPPWPLRSLSLLFQRFGPSSSTVSLLYGLPLALQLMASP